jgi:hypothetical protein
MESQTLTSFIMWCTIINGGLFVFWILFYMAFPDLVYRVQTKFFPMTKERFDIVFYCFLGAFKVFFIFFNVTPYIALLILEQS